MVSSWRHLCFACLKILIKYMKDEIVTLPLNRFNDKYRCNIQFSRIKDISNPLNHYDLWGDYSYDIKLN